MRHWCSRDWSISSSMGSGRRGGDFLQDNDGGGFFYGAIMFDFQMVLFLEDLNKDAYWRTCASLPPSNALFITKRVQLFGKSYCTMAQFCNNSRIHDVVTECDTMRFKDPCLEIQVDRKMVMKWRFFESLRWRDVGGRLGIDQKSEDAAALV